MSRISNKTAEEIERLVNATIRELVFFDHHVGDDQADDGRDNLVQAQMNLEQIQALMPKEET